MLLMRSFALSNLLKLSIHGILKGDFFEYLLLRRDRTRLLRLVRLLNTNEQKVNNGTKGGGEEGMNLLVLHQLIERLFDFVGNVFEWLFQVQQLQTLHRVPLIVRVLDLQD